MSRRVEAALLSAFVIPGAGQLHKGHKVKGWTLISACLVIISYFVYMTFDAALAAAGSMPPDELMMNAYSVAKRIMEENASAYTRVIYAFLAVWAVGVLDAYFTGQD